MGDLHLARRHTERAAQLLIITSNSELGGLIETTLESRGVRSLQVKPGSDLDNIAQENQIRTVLLDTGSMIDCDRTAVRIREIRSRFKSELACLIPPARPDAKLSCLAAGADVILEKPIHSDALYQEAGKVLLPCERKISFGGS